MTFVVLLHPKAAKELEKIEKKLKCRIIETLKELKNKSETMGRLLRTSDFWSLRIGDYCAVYEIDRADKRVMVLFIGHRENVYDEISKAL